MPTYAYGCDRCGFRFDRYQGFDDPPLTECPECGEDALRRLITPVGVVFKGSGFYSTDHRSPSGQGSSRRNDDSGPASKDGPGKDSSSKDGSSRNGSSKDGSSKDEAPKSAKEEKPAATSSQDRNTSS